MRYPIILTLYAFGFVVSAAGADAQVTPASPFPGPIGDRPGDVARGMITAVPDQTVPVSNPLQGQLIGQPAGTPGINNNNSSIGSATAGVSARPTPG